MNYTRTYGWYYSSSYDRAPAWTGVQFLYNFLIRNQSIGPYASEADLSEVELGDIIQLSESNGFNHSLIITGFESYGDDNAILISTHTFDAIQRLLNTYIYEKLRCLHIEGFRIF